MKRTEILKMPPKPPVFPRKTMTAQISEDGSAVILNGYHGDKLVGRYLMDKDTHAFCYLEVDSGKFREGKLVSMMGYSTYWGQSDYQNEVTMTPEDIELVRAHLNTHTDKPSRPLKFRDIANIVDTYEYEVGHRKRMDKEDRRIMRLKDMMAKFPPVPADMDDRIREWAAGGIHYAFFDKDKKEWTCTACKSQITEKELVTAEGKKATHNKKTICPRCKVALTAKKRVCSMAICTHGMLLQNVNEKMSAARHFDFWITWDQTGVHVSREESIRMFLYRPKFNPKKYLQIYYLQGGWGRDWFDKGNPLNRRTYEGYLYPEGIAEALDGTIYEGWTRLFTQMASKGTLLHYNRCMAMGSEKSIINMIEYLYKGKFEKLLRETAEEMDYWSGRYLGPLNAWKTSIEGVFGIQDRQKINRIRDKNGGTEMLYWMRWSEEQNTKIPDDTLTWLLDNDISVRNVSFITKKMSLTQIMNYVIRQQQESYKGKSIKRVLDQWEDYIRMCKQEKKDLNDPLTYRPRELKRRHDEMVAEIEKKQMMEMMKRDAERQQEQAEEMRAKYPGAEEILAEIRERYEYANEDYIIKVPTKLIEIMQEGHALHHCVSATDRYFERIRNRETYICFLRRAAEPDVPFYTIEVEPSGTIRQHRSKYDEEPGIDEIRGFLREWQKVLKKRLTEADRKYAAISAVKRQENIDDLKAKNNIRVLKGLEQDFMEAM